MGKLQISIELPEDAPAISQVTWRAAGEEMGRQVIVDYVEPS